MQLLAVVQKVELVGGESWLEHNSVAVAAISAAVLAALVAILNRRAQLKHDREMRNRDHVRDTIDQVVVLTSDAVKAAALFHTQLQEVESRREQQVTAEGGGSAPGVELKGDLSSFEEELRSRADDLYEALVALHPVNVRLTMRLGEVHAICETFEATRKAIENFYAEGVPGLDGNREQGQEGDVQRKELAREAFSAFRDACYDWFKDEPDSGWLRLRRPW